MEHGKYHGGSDCDFESRRNRCTFDLCLLPWLCLTLKVKVFSLAFAAYPTKNIAFAMARF